jgi:predicted glutamine amidotransferase
MIAKASSAITSFNEEMLTCPQSLYYLANQGRLPENPIQRGQHIDGCGIAFVENRKLKIHKRGSANAWDKTYVDVVNQARSNLFIAHNRLSSAGLESVAEGSHPFEIEAQGQTYSLSHNGTVYDWVNEAQQKSTTDSNLLLQKIISQTEENNEKQIIARLREIRNNCDFSSITGFLLSAEKLQVWRIFNETKSHKQDDYNLYYTLFMKLSKDAVVFASEPLDNEQWTLLPNNSFVSVEPDSRNLKLVYAQIEE